MMVTVARSTLSGLPTLLRVSADVGVAPVARDLAAAVPAADPAETAVVSAGDSVTSRRAVCSHQGHVSIFTAPPMPGDGFAWGSGMNANADEVIRIGAAGRARCHRQTP